MSKRRPDFEFDLFELCVRVLFDPKPRSSVGVVYLFANTRDNQESVIDTAVQLWKQREVKKIWVCDGTTDHGYPGFGDWHDELAKQGINTSHIEPVLVPGDLNTLSEARHLVNKARLENTENIFITSTPFHQLRSFITCASVVIKSRSGLKIYNKTGTPLDWLKVVAHSQGSLIGSRSELIRTEYERIMKYYRQGDLLHPAEILKYLDERG